MRWAGGAEGRQDERPSFVASHIWVNTSEAAGIWGNVYFIFQKERLSGVRCLQILGSRVPKTQV